jgi:hypothetical protein
LVAGNSRKDPAERFAKAIRSLSVSTVEPAVGTAAVELGGEDEPHATEPTLSVVADLEKGLTMEVDMPESITGFWIGLVQTLDVRQTTSAAEGVLKEGGFQLLRCWTKNTHDGASPALTEKNCPPSNS